MKKSILLILLALCICFGIVSCGKNEDELPSDTANSETSENTEYITIAEGGEVNYQIVYPRNPDEKIMTSSKDLFKAIEKRSNGIPKMHDDYSSANVQHDPEAFEILI